jgi:hypothetical protein
MTVTLNPTEFCYPDFKEGQVLTHNDLNRLRDHLYTKLAFHTRALFGFGVACGLDGTIAGSTLTLTPGFALAQGGRELIRDTATTVALGSLTTDPTVYPFIQTTSGGSTLGGYTAILRESEQVQAAGGTCDAAGCTIHTEVHCQSSEIVFVPGRLDLGQYLGGAVFALSPVSPATDPTLSGFVALRDALYTALSGLVDEATRNQLKALALTGPKGVDLLKVGIVNEVLYTLWNYYQCKQAQTTPCFGMTGNAAVALGWVHQSGGTWIWECRYRHHYRLSLALYRAMQGYRCEDVCGRYLDHVRLIVEDFTPPVVPDDPDDVEDPPDGGFHICTALEIKQGLCDDWWGGRDPHLPKDFLDPNKVQKHPKFPPDPDGPIVFPADGGDPWETIVNVNVLDPVQSGVINTHQVLGYGGEKTKEVLEKSILEAGSQPTVTVMTTEEMGDRRDIQPAVMAAASDSIYLGVNDAGAVAAVGIIPTSQTLAEVPGIANEARDASVRAGRALDDAAAARTAATQLEGGFSELRGDLTSLSNSFDSFTRRSSEQIGDFEVELRQEVQGLRESIPDTMVLQQAAGLGEEFGEMRKESIQLGDTVRAHGETLDRLDGEAERVNDRIDGMSRRFDAVAVRAAGGQPSPESVNEVNMALYKSLDSLREAASATATPETAPKVMEVLKGITPELNVIKGQVEAGVPLTEAEPEALTTVMDGMVRALQAAGLSADAPEVRDAQRQITELRSSLGLG